MNKNKVSSIRSFNRYYTNILGLLDQHILESDLSLSEVRVLHEIEKTEQCTSRMLVEILCMDAGYLSRILKKFYKMGLLMKEKSPEDGRAQYLYLTSEGKEKMEELNISSDEQIAQIIKPLTEIDKNCLVQNMTAIETILTNGANIKLEDITIRTDVRPGDLGYITHMHGWIYGEEYGYSTAFEGYVAESFHKFLLNYNPDNDRLWCAKHNGNIIGCIGIVGHGERAQLRWFLIDPHYRRIGLGKKLLQEALDFAKVKNYNSVYLDTTNDLDKAINMYKKAGFAKKSEKVNNSWREGLIELEFEMQL
ncbi:MULTISPECIES: helix-turn-helix domain-containing GNAT family N-acetyltransferase [unclassified Clostridium]|uniref:bifunctional helix-turn-helix transcriptional regulator/GNAT family N-acetyltransferase n=1 Tax=unclassified Clostridium TaxID=2614128 RepID=UPI00029750C5|nr:MULTISPECIES: helix-turn-helix domain-containing GNAT family N-acetyltransferase [unclassified Clostridium]EKQ56067.1 MAG: transcriptional regulator [Clostridium sp. Maddingley MBC34-26]